MQYLIFGADGQLGREFTDYMSKRNMTFDAYVFQQLDVTDSHKLEEAIKYHRPNVVINCSAYTQVDAAEDDAQNAFRVNHTAVREMAKLCKNYHAKLIHFSTDYVFPGLSEDRFTHPKGYSEDHRKDPLNVYGESKLLGENEVQRFLDDFIIMRVSWLCGKYGKNFIKTMITLASQGKDLRVINDQLGSPTFTEDVVINTINLVNQEKKGIYHCTTSGVISWYDLAVESIKLAGIEPKVEPVPTSEYPTRAIRPLYSKLNTEKIERIPDSRILPWQDSLVKYIKSLEL